MTTVESHWINPTINFGTIKRNKTKEFWYQALPTVLPIKKIHAGCGCTSLNYDPETKILKVTYKSGEMPKHIKEDYMEVLKFITVTYLDGSEETLYLKGTKLR